VACEEAERRIKGIPKLQKTSGEEKTKKEQEVEGSPKNFRNSLAQFHKTPMNPIQNR
jgi:hypothetical protein